VTYNRSVPPSASVVITSYNRSHLLPRAIESAQCAGKNLEVIVVDDCSSDDTPEVCAQIPDIRQECYRSDGARTADHFEHEGVRVHRVMLKPVWHAFNRVTRYSLTTTLHWLNFSTQAFRKLKQLHRQHPFHLIQYPNYSFCGLFSIPFLRSAHVVRASSYQPDWNDADGVKRNLDSAISERLEALQYKLTRNVFAPSNAMQKTLTKKAKVRDARVIPTPFYVETRQWDNTVYEQFLKGRKYALYFGRFHQDQKSSPK
jgi:hypothetical protein